VELAATWREAAFARESWSGMRHEHTAELSFEWDNFDRHTFPREGLLFRGRYGVGDALPGLAPEGSFRFGYLRVRGLTTLAANRSDTNMGVDLDVEWGYGSRLPLDRFWPLGGSSFLVGSQALSLQAPNFAVARLGFPLRMGGPFGLPLQVMPRVDYAVAGPTGADLFRDRRLLGTGVVVRTIFARFYVDLSYGFLRQAQAGSDWGHASGTFSALVGTQPFDIWKR